MDFIVELIGELIIELLFEGGIEIYSNRKLSKWIRYPAGVLLILFFAVIPIGIMVLGVFLWQENILASILIIGIGLLMLGAGVFKFRKIYLKEKQKRE